MAQEVAIEGGVYAPGDAPSELGQELQPGGSGDALGGDLRGVDGVLAPDRDLLDHVHGLGGARRGEACIRHLVNRLEVFWGAGSTRRSGDYACSKAARAGLAGILHGAPPHAPARGPQPRAAVENGWSETGAQGSVAAARDRR